MPVKLPNLGSGRTTSKVLICRHDRGTYVEKNGKREFVSGNKSDILDISSYVNNIAFSTNIYGGGSGTISVIPAFPWEDEIVANDIINIYFNTNRGDESGVYEKENAKTGKPADETWRYNRGNVRVFFGYIDHVSKNVAVGGIGTRITSYSITFSSFEKAVKATNVYSNPNLAFQVDFTDTIRPDISNNLGGNILIKKGFPISGSPRHLIIAHLFRTLGFGAQWILPESYIDNVAIKDSSKVGGFGHSRFFPWELGWLRKRRDPKDIKEFGRFPFYWKPLLTQDFTAGQTGVEICFNTSFKYFPRSNPDGKDSRTKNDFVSALAMVGDTTSMVDLSNKGELAGLLASFVAQADGSASLQRVIANLTTKLILYGNLTYWIGSGTDGKLTPDERTVLEHLGTDLVTGIHKGVSSGQSTLINLGQYDTDFWRHYYENKTPHISPMVNHTTDPKGAAKAAKTLFNILCLDYMEDVDGSYIMSEMYNFGGPLYSQIQRQSNDLIAELFFDLRVIPDFTPRDFDGLGVEMDGALPMVAAIIHREKPFTNYNSSVTKGTTGTGLSANKTKISIMPFLTPAEDKDTDHDLTSMTGDQYVMEAQGLKSFRALIGGAALYKKIQGVLQTIDGVVPIKPEGIKQDTGPTRARSKRTDGKGVPLSQIGTVLVGNTPTAYFQYQAKVKETAHTLAAKPYSLRFTLPRPVFRSPDNHRITQELKIASMQTILGFLTGTKKDVQFVAFGTDTPSDTTIANSNIKGDQTWGGGSYKAVGEGHKHLFTLPYAGSTGDGKIKPSDRPVTWHILDYMTIRDEDVMSESYSRGDFQISNIRELHIDFLPDFEVQRATVADILPIITPVSIYRSGIRVAPNNSTTFIQYMLTGGTDDPNWHQALGLRWAIMLDMWEQHNHEYLSGTLSIRGMPGLRVGYRIDRKELNLSFYVNSVSHNWEYPGMLVTQLSVSRGQPMKTDDVLPYYEPEPWVAANQQQRIKLGRVFRSSDVPHGEQLGAGALTNLKTQIKDLEWEG